MYVASEELLGAILVGGPALLTTGRYFVKPLFAMTRTS